MTRSEWIVEKCSELKVIAVDSPGHLDAMLQKFFEEAFHLGSRNCVHRMAKRWAEDKDTSDIFASDD